MKQSLDDIIRNKKPCYFISPHLDDAALSCGGLIDYLAGKTAVTVITVFTEVKSSSNTISGVKTLKNSGFSDPRSLYSARRAEDTKAFSKLPVRVIHLGETEALWRNKRVSPLTKWLSRILPELEHVYPTYRFHIARGQVSSKDKNLINRIDKQLKTLIQKKAVVFAPTGVGKHVDHVLTRTAAEKSFHPILWLDQPYLIRENSRELAAYTEFTVNQKKKEALVSPYKTQIPLLFPGTFIPQLREYYLIPR